MAENLTDTNVGNIEYIRKADASDWLKQYGRNVLHGKYKFSLMYIWKNIMNLPSADVAPVVHGKWIPHREKSREYIGTVLAYVMYDYWLCDTCGYRVEYGQPMYNFCPNCGAKMDGGES